MAKSTAPKIPVPAHLFETMLRSAMNSEGGLKVWKDDLLHWHYTAAQLDQLISALKVGGKNAVYKEIAKETIEFIESKVKG